jgi:hypothetical protein
MFLVEDRKAADLDERAFEEKLAAAAGIYAANSHYWPPIGVDRVDLYLTSSAGHRLLDATSARFQTAANEVLQYFTVSHGGALRGDKPVCAGLYTVYAHNRVHYWEGLTFGGMVSITARYAYTHVAITSRAPIFVLMGNGDPIQHLLFDELMAAVARHRAEAHESDSEYARRLAKADPYALFLASLGTLHDMARHGPPSMAGSQHVEVQRAVQRMIDAVRKQDGWPAQLPQLQDLL